MDELDRMFRRLVQNIKTGYPENLTHPFEVAELYQNLIPYRHNRRELALDTNQDYELTLMRLISGERGYLAGDEEMQQALTVELSGRNPDIGAFRQYEQWHVAITNDGKQRYEDVLSKAPEPGRKSIMEPRNVGGTSVGDMAPPPVPPNEAPPKPASARPLKEPASGSYAAPPAAGSLLIEPRSGPSIPAATKVMSPPVAPARQGVPSSPPPSAPPSSAAPPSAPPSPPSPPAPSRAAAARPTPPTVPAPAAPVSQSARPPQPGTAASLTPSAAMPTQQRTTTAEAHGGRCRYCDGSLPAGRALTFCPHCGQNLTVVHCPACNSELEMGWKFCVTCGRGIAEH
jgi:hypothetical protein